MTVLYKHNLHNTKIAADATAYTLTTLDSTYLGYNGQTITLPNPSTCLGQKFVIKLPTTYSTGITISAGAYTIDGSSTYSINTDYGFVELISKSDNWSVTNSSFNINRTPSSNIYTLKLTDNQASSLDIKEGATSYLKFDTTDNAEKIVASKQIQLTGNLTIKDGSNNTVFSVDTTTGITTGTTTTQTALDNSTKIASTAYVQNATRITLNAQTTNYTLAVADEGKMITMNSASATTVTIPLNSSISLATGSQIIISRIGAGTVNISPTGGVTLNSVSSNRYIANQYGAVTLIKTATDTWYLFGDLSAS